MLSICSDLKIKSNYNKNLMRVYIIANFALLFIFFILIIKYFIDYYKGQELNTYTIVSYILFMILMEFLYIALTVNCPIESNITKLKNNLHKKVPRCNEEFISFNLGKDTIYFCDPITITYTESKNVIIKINKEIISIKTFKNCILSTENDTICYDNNNYIIIYKDRLLCLKYKNYVIQFANHQCEYKNQYYMKKITISYPIQFTTPNIKTKIYESSFFSLKSINNYTEYINPEKKIFYINHSLK